MTEELKQRLTAERGRTALTNEAMVDWMLAMLTLLERIANKRYPRPAKAKKGWPAL